MKISNSKGILPAHRSQILENCFFNELAAQLMDSLTAIICVGSSVDGFINSHNLAAHLNLIIGPNISELF